ncbi:hypothetical protein Rhe02_24570 [Rhizocola hellebori]|uniref:Uncharacterized protein n=1 Tax=Rhizocola hellebori TaxID=1392758 RepID=A0A8J3VFB9_9ACTN|nr:hypothetical protein Rhe02_24570 [Rhizocola hellebori]
MVQLDAAPRKLDDVGEDVVQAGDGHLQAGLLAELAYHTHVGIFAVIEPATGQSPSTGIVRSRRGPDKQHTARLIPCDTVGAYPATFLHTARLLTLS